MITMSSPGAMPSSRTPTTSPVKPSGVVPLLTVSPSTGSPAASSATGNGSAQSGVGSADWATRPRERRHPGRQARGCGEGDQGACPGGERHVTSRHFLPTGAVAPIASAFVSYDAAT